MPNYFFSYISSLCIALFLCMVTAPFAQASAFLGDTRIWDAADHTRIVFDLTGTVRYKLFTLSNPDRVVIDFLHTRMSSSRHSKPAKKSFIKRIRYAPRPDDAYRVVLDVRQSMRVTSSLLAPSKVKPRRLVVDLWPKSASAKHHAQQQVGPKSHSSKQHRKRGLVIAVDAGH
ncbi:MAG: AMIN domain-containing protein, partial [Mariprofundaceae bacterium]|nr:AMIN domain-containing protein [Mariprofundaceae bacterium]